MQLTAQQAAAILARQFPAFAHATVVYLGEGCDSTAFEVNGEWVFRFPKHSYVDPHLGIEARVLQVIGARSLLPVPAIAYVGEPSEIFPYHFTGYRKLAGVPGIRLSPDDVPFARIAQPLGRFLSGLHAIPASEVAGLGLPARVVADVMDQIRTEALEDCQRVSAAVPDLLLPRWRDFLEASPPRGVSGTTELIHGDLAAEHVLLDPDTYEIAGIIDWADVQMGDPVTDLAGMFHWGGASFFEAVAREYGHPVSQESFEKARFVAACRGMGDIAFGVEKNRPEYVRAGLRALSLTIG
jgi:aminoglycoside phosphotransferase (APT) family kinase protein